MVNTPHTQCGTRASALVVTHVWKVRRICIALNIDSFRSLSLNGTKPTVEDSSSHFAWHYHFSANVEMAQDPAGKISCQRNELFIMSNVQFENWASYFEHIQIFIQFVIKNTKMEYFYKTSFVLLIIFLYRF